DAFHAYSGERGNKEDGHSRKSVAERNAGLLGEGKGEGSRGRRSSARTPQSGRGRLRAGLAGTQSCLRGDAGRLSRADTGGDATIARVSAGGARHRQVRRELPVQGA